MLEFFQKLDEKSYRFFHSIWAWLIIAGLFFIAWFFKSTLIGFIFFLIVLSALVFFQSDMKMLGLVMMLGYMSISEMPYFDTLTVGIYGMIISGCLGCLLLYLKRVFIIKKARWSFGPVGLSLSLLVLWSFISSILNQLTANSKYVMYGYVFDGLCLLLLLIYFFIVSGGEKEDKAFITKAIYIINILLVAQSFSNMITTKTVIAGFYLGWGTKNLVAMTLEFCIPYAAYIFSKNHKRAETLLFIIIDYVLVFLSESRGASVTIAILTVLVAFILAYNFKSCRLKGTLLILSGVIVAFCFVLTYPSELQESILRIFRMGDDISGREKIWEQALIYFNNSPIAGGSYTALFEIYEYFTILWGGVFPPGVVGVMLCHNNFITILASLGIIGVLIFLFDMFETCYSAYKADDKLYMYVLVYIIIFSLSHGMIDNTFFSVQYMLPFIIIFSDSSLPSFGDAFLKAARKESHPTCLD